MFLIFKKIYAADIIYITYLHNHTKKGRGGDMPAITNNSYYINQNTGQLTTNLANTAFRGTKEEFEAIRKTYALGGNMYTGAELERMQTELKNGMFERLNLGNKNSLDKVTNSLNLGIGKTFTLHNGKILTLNSSGRFEVSGGNPYDQDSSQKASDIAGALNILLKYSANQISESALLFSSGSQKQQWSADALEGLEYLGIDTTRDFTLNGTKFTVNDGILQSQAYSDAQAAYEFQLNKNKTYLGADEQTKIRINYQTNYYLRNASEEVKEAWTKALKETDFNPFSNSVPNTLFQLSTEQDFKTKGNDDIFGSTIESAMNAAEALLERAGQPLGEADKDYNGKELEFYNKFISNLHNI